MQISREKLIEINGKKEKVQVSFDIPISAFKSKDDISEECGEVGLEGKTTEQVIDETIGAVCNVLANYMAATLHCGYHSGEAILILQSSIVNSGKTLGELIRDWKELDEMR